MCGIFVYIRKLKDMNRVIIVGNGFDLAHNLKTRYEDFMNWYWCKWLKQKNNSISQFEEDELFKIGAKYNSDCLCNYFYLGCTERNVYKYIEKVRQENGLSYIISVFSMKLDYRECQRKKRETMREKWLTPPRQGIWCQGL